MLLNFSSWNVNGIRACSKNGFVSWLNSSNSDFIGLQEVRAEENQIPPEVLDFPGFHKNWFPAQKKGYSGVGILSKEKPQKIQRGLGIAEFDSEGRVLIAHFEKVIFVSAYFPNSQDKGARLGFKLEFCKELARNLNDLYLKTKKCVVLCGDYNIAPFPIDLARPNENQKTAGYLPEERAWMIEFLDSGWVDTFRYKNPDKTEAYSWWSARLNARSRNLGWRIDFHSVPEAFKGAIVEASIHDKVLGSDHCPVSLKLDL
jgi:exodeoxyribonuclease-3